jgi:hypothetical protein
MAEYVFSYKASGILSVGEMELTEVTKKEGTKIHDLDTALKRFEGQDINISITVKEEVSPKDVEAQEEE